MKNKLKNNELLPLMFEKLKINIFEANIKSNALAKISVYQSEKVLIRSFHRPISKIINFNER